MDGRHNKRQAAEISTLTAAEEKDAARAGSGGTALPVHASKKPRPAAGGAGAAEAEAALEQDGDEGGAMSSSAGGSNKGRSSLPPSKHAGPATFTVGGFKPATSMAAFVATLPRRTHVDASGQQVCKVVSFNVNGLRSWTANKDPSRRKDFLAYLAAEDADVVCLQETRVDDDYVAKENVKALLSSTNPFAYFSCSTAKKGYAGVAIFSCVKPASVTAGLAGAAHEGEGRLLTADYGHFFLVNVYVPNSGMKLERLDYRTVEWDVAMRSHLTSLARVKPVVVVGDLNVAYRDMDIHAPKPNRNRTPGFCDAERDGFATLLAAGFHDVWREAHPHVQQFTYWSARPGLRDSNKGWRLDYVLTGGEPALPVRVDVRHAFPANDHVPLAAEITLPVGVSMADHADTRGSGAAAARVAASDGSMASPCRVGGVDDERPTPDRHAVPPMLDVTAVHSTTLRNMGRDFNLWQDC